jgi:signal transduction histidine kinase
MLNNYVVYLCLLLLSLIPQLILANLDSLLLRLSQSPPNSIQRMEVLTDLASYYHRIDPEEAIYYSQQLLEEAREISSPKHIHAGYMSIGVGYAMQGTDMDKALEQFIKALDLANQYDGEDWKLLQVKSSINISGIHYNNNDIPKALKYAYSYTKVLEGMQESYTLGGAYQALALMHQTNETWDSVFIYLGKAKQLYIDVNETHRLAETRVVEGEAFSSQKNYTKALEIFNSLLTEAIQSKDTALVINLCPALAETYLELGQVDNAKYYAYKGLNLTRGRSLIKRESEYYEMLYRIFNKKENYDSALHYYKAYAEAKSAMLNEEKAKAIEELETRLQVRQRVRENERLKETVKAKNIQNRLLLLCSVLFLGLLLSIIYYYNQLKKQKQELEHLNLEVFEINSQLLSLMNEKKHMVNLIAHDIRNPLSLIQLNTHALAQEGMLEEEERQQVLQEIEAATTAIDQASLKIMEIENKSEGGITIQKDTFDVTPALQDARKEFLSYATSKNIQLQFQLPKEGQFIVGDPFLFRHIMANFISNALKYSPHGSVVDILLSDHDEQVAISVVDQGPGLNKEQQQRIFKRGRIAQLQPTAGERALGEGLYLTKRYVEAMDGSIEVESTPGEGSTFRVLFPKGMVG